MQRLSVGLSRQTAIHLYTSVLLYVTVSVKCFDGVKFDGVIHITLLLPCAHLKIGEMNGSAHEGPASHEGPATFECSH